MKTRSLVMAALGSVFILGAAAPAFADRDDWERGEWREHRHGWHPGYYPRPAYYPPAPVYYPPPPVYYAPPAYYAPPVYYAPPIVSFGFSLR